MAKKVLSGKDNTNGFQKNPQNINRTGANRKTIASVNLELESKGFIASNTKDITDCYLRLIGVSLSELREISNDNEQPALVRIVGKAILSDKGFDIIEKMLDRGIGKAINRIGTEDGKGSIEIKVTHASDKDNLEKL